MVRQTLVSFFGFRWSAKHRTYHFPLDPTVLCNSTIRELIPDEGDPVLKLLIWALEVREFCERHALPVRPTAGGIASALLRDPRFYPAPRRKVPRMTNNAGRDHLPGNFYDLYAKPNHYYQALYLDQSRAHHNAARSIDFPNANDLYAIGRFHKGEKLDEKREWFGGDDERIRRLAQCHGLLYARVSNPHLPATAFVPHYMKHSGSKVIGLFTNEIPDYLDQGGRIEAILAGWISRTTDPGLNLYAEWAIEQLDATPADQLPWLKPLLLSTYGMLAARPRRLESGYRTAKGGEVKFYPAGPHRLRVLAKTTEREVELPVVNAIHRGMIEAETRVRSLKMARDLHAAGRRILAVYADSVFIEDDGGELPLLPKPWGIQARLTDLVFYSSTAFASRELTKLPGIPRSARFRHSRRTAIRVPVRGTIRA